MPDEKDWRQFIQITSGQPPWPRLVRAASAFAAPGEALDVGAGGGRDTDHLLRQGWRVTAVDASAAAAAAARRLPRQRNLTFVQSRIEEFEPETYDLVNAQFSLPFITPERYEATVRGLLAAVRPGGVLAATFFGPRDEWNQPGSDLNFTTEPEVRRLFDGWEVQELTEVEEDGKTADGTPKHWHVFHVIAKRPAAA